MKRNNLYSVVLLVTIIFISNFASANQPLTDREHLIKPSEKFLFSQNILTALLSENAGLKVSAMQKVVKYKDLIDLNSTALELIRVYRKSYDEKMRMLALVTINAIQNDWALGIIKRDLEFEKSPTIKNLMIAVLNNDLDVFEESEEITAFLQ